MLFSYAQNLEDILLMRALSHVSAGFYIDVGGFHPVTDSVTKLFYDKGWMGINIEASRDLFAAFVTDRPRDINLNMAASDKKGDLKFYQIGHTGLSTLEAPMADRHSRSGMASVSYTVPSDTLASICKTHVTGDIHFLKIDVEGAEASVLRGADFSRYRPWIVLVEATEPLSSKASHQLWESLLTENGYEFTVFDGLNRFYIAREHQELKPALSFPADDYERATAYWTRGHYENKAREMEGKLEALRKLLS